MVTNLKDLTIFTDSKRLTIEEKIDSNEAEIIEYSNLVKQLEKKMIPLEAKGKYIFIEFLKYSVPSSAMENFYEVQLLGYVPVIANAELNMDFRRNPNKLYMLVAKGALVQIDETSIIGRKGKTIRKFSIKLCRHHLVHFVLSEAVKFTKKHVISEKVMIYLQKKVSADYVDYLQANAKHIYEGTHFHPKTAIKFR